MSRRPLARTDATRSTVDARRAAPSRPAAGARVATPADRAEAGPHRRREREAADQDAINRRVYHAAGVHRKYREDRLTAAEITLLAAHGGCILDRDVLELGAGTGRATRHLLRLARRYVGVDYAPALVRRAREALPQADVRVLDMRDLGAFEPGSFDCVLALCNVLDAVCHEDRLEMLAGIHRILRADGTLIFSSHNRRHRDAGAPPSMRVSRNPLIQLRHLARYLLEIRNHRRLRTHRRHEVDHALLDDPGHHYSLLHYYTSRSDQRRQLAGAGFLLLDAIARDGRVLAPEEDDADTPDILYVARRKASVG